MFAFSDAVREGKRIHLTIGKSDAAVSAGAVVLAANGYISKVGYFKNQVLILTEIR